MTSTEQNVVRVPDRVQWHGGRLSGAVVETTTQELAQRLPVLDLTITAKGVFDREARRMLGGVTVICPPGGKVEPAPEPEPAPRRRGGVPRADSTSTAPAAPLTDSAPATDSPPVKRTRARRNGPVTVKKTAATTRRRTASSADAGEQSAQPETPAES